MIEERDDWEEDLQDKEGEENGTDPTEQMGISSARGALGLLDQIDLKSLVRGIFQGIKTAPKKRKKKFFAFLGAFFFLLFLAAYGGLYLFAAIFF